MYEDLLFYDIEVTEHDALVVFMDIEKNEIDHFWNIRGRKTKEDPSGFEGIPELIKGKTLVGYNNYNYDDHILTAMMSDQMSLPHNLFGVNNAIIHGNGTGRPVSPLIRSLDVMQQIDVSRPSLKQVEGNMGISIVESPISFNVDRELKDDERKLMWEYCCHDVMATIDIFKLREKSYFEPKAGLIALLPDSYPDNAYRWNTTTISANVLLGNEKSSIWRKNKVPKELWRNVDGIPSSVWDMWEEIMTEDHITDKGKSKTIDAFKRKDKSKCKVVFGMGGLHAAPSAPLRCGRVKHKDVASMYPSSIVRLQALGDATGKYDEMRKERIQIKKKDPVKAAALKLILNSVYGNFKNQYSSLYNPMASATVCVYGQIALFDLCQQLHNAGYEIINGNTDGVVYRDEPSLNDADERICAEWEKKYEGYTLETDYYTKWIQRDVNNYIAMEEDGSITVKGGDVNKYQVNKYFSNNSARIVQIALVDYLIDGNENDAVIFDTFSKHMNQPLLWQYILKAGGTYKCVQNHIGTEMNKVNRVFAASNKVPSDKVTKLYKVRQDDGLVNFPDVPERMFVWNEDVNDLENFEEYIDQDYYYRLVKEKLKGWKT